MDGKSTDNFSLWKEVTIQILFNLLSLSFYKKSTKITPHKREEN